MDLSFFTCLCFAPSLYIIKEFAIIIVMEYWVSTAIFYRQEICQILKPDYKKQQQKQNIYKTKMSLSLHQPVCLMIFVSVIS